GVLRPGEKTANKSIRADGATQAHGHSRASGTTHGMGNVIMKIGKTCGLSAMTHGYPLKGHDKRPTWTKHRLAEKARHR
ncbi:hypothetical protein ATR1_298d0001, partial [Acetobacter tropicalis]